MAHFIYGGAVALVTKKLLKRIMSIRPGMATCRAFAGVGVTAATTLKKLVIVMKDMKLQK